MSDLQTELETYQKAISGMRESVGAIGGDGSAENVSNLSDLQESFYESLTTAAITQTVVVELEGETIDLDRIARIEHQSWIRGFDTDGDLQVVNLMDVNQIYAA
jgi:hypothetical protein